MTISLQSPSDAQNRIQNSKVLVCGLSGLHIEVVKNLVLAGMNITIQDSENVKIKDLAHNYFVSSSDVGLNVSRIQWFSCHINLQSELFTYDDELAQNAAAALQNIQQLNTFTEVNIVTKGISELDEEFLQSFSVILLNDCDEVRIKSHP